MILIVPTNAMLYLIISFSQRKRCEFRIGELAERLPRDTNKANGQIDLDIWFRDATVDNVHR